MDSLAFTPEHLAALQRYETLLEQLPISEEEKEQLINHLLPILHARYLSLVGESKLGLLNIQLEAFVIRRKVEMARAAIHRGSAVLIEVIETLIAAEAKEQREKIEHEARRLQDALLIRKMEVLDEKEAAELKKLFRELARRLHPDINPNLSDSQRHLWTQVCDAYQRGDLAKLKVLMIQVDAHVDTLDASKVGVNYLELIERVKSLQAVLDANTKQIEQVKNSFPYTIRELMEDENWVASQNAMTREATAKVMIEIDVYKKILDTLLPGE